MRRSLVKPVALLLLAVVILFALGFRWSHPKDGLSNALGAAKSTIVIYQKTTSIAVGSKVIASVDAPTKSPVIAVVSGITGENVDLQAGATLVRVKKSQVSGKLIAVVPFIGALISMVGQ